MTKYIVTGHISTHLTEEEVLDILSESYDDNPEFYEQQWDLKVVPLKGRPARAYELVRDYFKERPALTIYSQGELLSAFEEQMKPATLTRVLKQHVAEGHLDKQAHGTVIYYENSMPGALPFEDDEQD